MTRISGARGVLVVGALLLASACSQGADAPRVASSGSQDSSWLALRPVLSEQPISSTPGSPAGVPSGATPGASPTDGSDLAWIDADLLAQAQALRCSDHAVPAKSLPERPLAACSQQGDRFYLLGPAEVRLSDIADASAAAEAGGASGQWSVKLRTTAAGQETFRRMTQRLVALPGARNQLAIVVDSVVISAPSVAAAIDVGLLQISGAFDETQATALADRIRRSVR